MADFTYANSQSASSRQQAQLITQALSGSPYSNSQQQYISNAFANIGGAEGGGQSGVVLNTAYNIPGTNYTPPAAGDSPEFSVGYWGMNLYDQGNYNLAAQALGQPQISSQPSGQQAYSLGQQFAGDPQAQAVAAVALMQQDRRAGASGFAPWTDPASPNYSLSDIGVNANSWNPSPATGGGPVSANAATAGGSTLANPEGTTQTPGTTPGTAGSATAGLMSNCSGYRTSSAATTNCIIGGGGGLLSVPCVLNACNAKAVISGFILLSGGILMLAGTALLFAGKSGVLGKAADAAGAVVLVKGATSFIQSHAPKSGGLSDSAQRKASTQSLNKTGGGNPFKSGLPKGHQASDDFSEAA